METFLELLCIIGIFGAVIFAVELIDRHNNKRG